MIARDDGGFHRVALPLGELDDVAVVSLRQSSRLQPFLNWRVLVKIRNPTGSDGNP